MFHWTDGENNTILGTYIGHENRFSIVSRVNGKDIIRFNSKPPKDAEKLYNLLLNEFDKSGLKVESGSFGAKMDIALNNDGPVTIMLDNEELFQSK